MAHAPVFVSQGCISTSLLFYTWCFNEAKRFYAPWAASDLVIKLNGFVYLYKSTPLHFSCFHLLAIVTNAAMSTRVKLPLWELISNSFSQIGSWKVLLLYFVTFWGISVMFTIEAAPFCLPPSNIQGLYFSFFLWLWGDHCVVLMVVGEHLLAGLLVICMQTLCLFKPYLQIRWLLLVFFCEAVGVPYIHLCIVLLSQRRERRTQCHDKQ